MAAMRPSTLETLGLGSVLDIFARGALPFTVEAAVEQVFGPATERGSLVVSGANGIVGAGKLMQLGSRLLPHGVTLVGLDFPGAPDGIGRQYKGLRRAMDPARADAIMAEIVRFHYDGKSLPPRLKDLRPRVLLEAIPEILDLKKAHYGVFRKSFPGIDIHSVTSGFPSSQLGVGIAHPAFPHEINKVWEIVEARPSAFTQMLWALGLVPMQVSDRWSFVLDVLFCGLTNAAANYKRASNIPSWKVDKLARRAFGPNPFRAHDAIGAKGANFLTWSCLHHLLQAYGPLFTPAEELTYRKDSGQDWYPLNHLRPLVNWTVDAEEDDLFQTWVLGPLIQMTSLLLHEQRSHLSQINAIGELCAQFRRGLPAMIRGLGADAAIQRVEAYHRLHPEAATSCWYPEAFARMGEAEWQQLYVNAEHDGQVGVISLSRESYNADVDAELNRAMDWLKLAGIERVILGSDFHLSTQMVGADTADFYPALSDVAKGTALSAAWSRTARRLHADFQISVGLISGKRCLGGMLELMTHCHVLLACHESSVGMPEATLPVIPGMEGCHWAFRRTDAAGRQKLLRLLLTGKPEKSAHAVGWLVDASAPLEEILKTAWSLAKGQPCDLHLRPMETQGFPVRLEGELPPAPHSTAEAARRAILDCVIHSCAVPLSEALDIQARHSGEFMAGALCNAGIIGTDAVKVLNV